MEKINCVIKIWENNECRDAGFAFEEEYENTMLQYVIQETNKIFEIVGEDGGAVELWNEKENELLVHISNQRIENYTAFTGMYKINEIIKNSDDIIYIANNLVEKYKDVLFEDQENFYEFLEEDGCEFDYFENKVLIYDNETDHSTLLTTKHYDVYIYKNIYLYNDITISINYNGSVVFIDEINNTDVSV